MSIFCTRLTRQVITLRGPGWSRRAHQKRNIIIYGEPREHLLLYKRGKKTRREWRRQEMHFPRTVYIKRVCGRGRDLRDRIN